MKRKGARHHENANIINGNMANTKKSLDKCEENIFSKN